MFIFTTPYETASRISSCVEPEPPWNTKSTGSAPVLRAFCDERLRVAQDRRLELDVAGRVHAVRVAERRRDREAADGSERVVGLQHVRRAACRAWSASTPELSTPSSSPPVTPSSISSVIFILAMRVRYLRQISRFSSSGSSDRSSMCELNSGSPFLREVLLAGVDARRRPRAGASSRSDRCAARPARRRPRPACARAARPRSTPAIDACCAALSSDLPA